jgi:DNA-directed RNA polymerase subunit RPC12/RpoP
MRNTMSRINHIYKDENSAFICGNCGNGVVATENGTLNRNHCPACLWSRHVDLRTGDRMSVCRGMMEPIGIWVKSDGEWSLIHRCVKCGSLRTNRIAGDDSYEELMRLASKPAVMPCLYFNEVNGEKAVRKQTGVVR